MKNKLLHLEIWIINELIFLELGSKFFEQHVCSQLRAIIFFLLFEQVFKCVNELEIHVDLAEKDHNYGADDE